MIACTVGVFAHNEAQNVRCVLQALLHQHLTSVTIVEIIVVASGCTDQTVDFARQIADANPLVTLEVEERRTGKAAAIRRLMTRARGEVIVFVGADTLPAPTAIEHLVAPFTDRTIGMTGARVVPLNAATSFVGFAVQMLWTVHHQLALREPKLGELVACRNILGDFPDDTAADDLALEALISRGGYRLVYTPLSTVYNRGPETLSDFLLQRRRIFAGEVRVALKYHYLASSLSLRHLLPLAVDAIRAYPGFLVWTLAVMGLELWARLLGMCDTIRGTDHVVWRHAASTKSLVTGAAPVSLVSVRWPPGEAYGSALLSELRDIPASVGSVFWWNRHHGEVLVRLDDPESLEWLRGRLRLVAGAHQGAAPSAAISCSMVHLSASSLPGAS